MTSNSRISRQDQQWERGFLPGDIRIWKDFNFTGWVARVLIKVRDMLPLRETWNHVSIAVGPFRDISAEVGRGVKEIDLSDHKKVRHSELRVYRFRKLTARQRQKILEESKKHLGKKYATTFWVLNGLTIILFYFFLLHIIPLVLLIVAVWAFKIPLDLKILLYILGVFTLLWIVLRFAVDQLRQRDHLYEHCSENFALVLGAVRLWSPLVGNANHDFPNGILQVLENLRLQKAVELVHIKLRGQVYPCPSAPIPPVLKKAPLKPFLARLLP